MYMVQYNETLIVKIKIVLYLELENTPVGDTRSRLVNEIYSLLDDWK